jgi:aconitate hydratase
MSSNSFGARANFKVGKKNYELYRLDALDKQGISTRHLPFSLRILLENLLRTEDGRNVTKDEIRALAAWNKNSKPEKEIAFTPSRVLLQDFTGVPAVVDLAAMRDAMKRLGGDAKLINPLQPAELVIDHSVQVDEFGSAKAFDVNALLEFQRNKERYAFLRWGQTGFRNLSCRQTQESFTKSILNIWLAWFLCTKKAKSAPRIPTRWSAPTPTPPWSTGSACSAGASAASRPKPPC